MDSLKRIIIGLVLIALLFIATLYIYQVNSTLALIFNMIVFAFTCSIVAHKKSRNKVGFFFIGLFLGFFGLAYVLAMPGGNEEANDANI